jgi:hypothetical protein
MMDATDFWGPECWIHHYFGIYARFPGFEPTRVVFTYKAVGPYRFVSQEISFGNKMKEMVMLQARQQK